MAALPGGHREDDGLGLGEEAVVDFVDLELHFDAVEPGEHGDELPEGAHFADFAELLDEVLEVEGAFLELLLEGFGVLLAHGFLGLLDEGEEVTHAEDAAGEAVGVEGLEGIGFFADADELDGDAGDGADAEGGAAAGVAVHFREDEPGGADALVELFGGIDGILTGHSVGDEEDFLGLEEAAQLGHLTLNGFAFFQHGVFTEPRAEGTTADDVSFRLDEDLPLIQWLRQNVEGSPVIVEAVGPLYRWTGRISEYTGLPAVIGWDWHQIQQRTDYAPLVQQRRTEVQRFYTDPSTDFAERFLRKYNVQYVIVGTEERVHGTEPGLAKLAAMPALSEVFRDGPNVIYRVDQARLAADILASDLARAP